MASNPGKMNKRKNEHRNAFLFAFYNEEAIGTREPLLKGALKKHRVKMIPKYVHSVKTINFIDPLHTKIHDTIIKIIRSDFSNKEKYDRESHKYAAENRREMLSILQDRVNNKALFDEYLYTFIDRMAHEVECVVGHSKDKEDWKYTNLALNEIAKVDSELAFLIAFRAYGRIVSHNGDYKEAVKMLEEVLEPFVEKYNEQKAAEQKNAVRQGQFKKPTST